MCVCICIFLFIYIISIGISVSIICVSQGNLSFIASKEQIFGLYKWVILELHIGKNILDTIELFIQCNTGSCCKWLYVRMRVRVRVRACVCVI